MKKNMGKYDRNIKVIVGLLFSFLCFAGIVTGLISIILIVLSTILIGTSIIGYCPLYGALGISTCKK